MMVRTALASDDIMWRQAAWEFIATSKLKLVGEASDGVECLELCAEYMPDLLILKFLGSGHESSLKEVRAEYPSVVLLDLSQWSETDLPIETLSSLGMPRAEFESIKVALVGQVL